MKSRHIEIKELNELRLAFKKLIQVPNALGFEWKETTKITKSLMPVQYCELLQAIESTRRHKGLEKYGQFFQGTLGGVHQKIMLDTQGYANTSR